MLEYPLLLALTTVDNVKTIISEATGYIEFGGTDKIMFFRMKNYNLPHGSDLRQVHYTLQLVSSTKRQDQTWYYHHLCHPPDGRKSSWLPAFVICQQPMIVSPYVVNPIIALFRRFGSGHLNWRCRPFCCIYRHDNVVYPTSLLRVHSQENEWLSVAILVQWRSCRLMHTLLNRLQLVIQGKLHHTFQTRQPPVFGCRHMSSFQRTWN